MNMQPAGLAVYICDDELSPAGQFPRHLLQYVQTIQAAEASPNATFNPLLVVWTAPNLVITLYC